MFAPFPTKDAIKTAALCNMHRTAALKLARPLIAANPAQYQLLKIAQDAYAKECDVRRAKAVLTVFKERTSPNACRAKAGAQLHARLQKLETLAVKWAERSMAVQALPILSTVYERGLSALKPNLHKLYVVCHGSAGDDFVSGGVDEARAQAEMSSRQLAMMLKTSGLHRAFTDVRIMSCYSADARRPQSFDPSELAACAAPNVKYIKGRPVLALPFAQRLSQALGKLGFPNPAVAGYHGISVQDQRGNRVQCGNMVRLDSVAVKASTVRARFGPRLPPVPPPPPGDA